MATTFTERTIAFLSQSGSFDQTGILSDTSVVAAAELAAGKVVQTAQKPYLTENGGMYTQSWTFELIFFLSTANDATVVASIPAIAARWPSYSVVTWSHVLVYGT